MEFDVEKLKPGEVPEPPPKLKRTAMLKQILPVGDLSLSGELLKKSHELEKLCQEAGLDFMIVISLPFRKPIELKDIVRLINNHDVEDTQAIVNILGDFDSGFHGDKEYLIEMNQRLQEEDDAF